MKADAPTKDFTRNFNTARLTPRKAKNPAPFLIGLVLLLALACNFYQNLLMDITAKQPINMGNTSADELFINAETEKTRELLRREQERTRK